MMQALPFRKMHGLGNDFVVINGITQPIDKERLDIPRLADRHIGIGFDQLLWIEPSTKADVFCRIFNADGSEAEQCGNGMRCVARFIHEEGLSTNTTLTIETKAGIVTATILNEDTVQVVMGLPRFEPHEIPFLLEHSANMYEVADVSPNDLSILSMGNPHAVVKVPSLDQCPIQDIGKKMSVHPAFPAGVNTGFVEVVDRTHIRLRTFERGAGETLSCGSNACAAVVAGINNGWLDHQVTVELSHGNLLIEWQGDQSPVMMTGPAEFVFTGIVQVKYF